MRFARFVTFGIVAAWLLGGVISAHEVSYKGTVTKVEAAKIQVKVTDDTTKKESTMDFKVSEKTKIFRGDKTVKLADAHIAKDERIVVTVNHDQSPDIAMEIRLAAQK